MNLTAEDIRKRIPSFLALAIGSFYLYSVYSFLAGLGAVYSVAARANWNIYLVFSLIVASSGFGVSLGVIYLLAKRVRVEAIALSVAYSFFLFAANFYFTAMPGMSTCHCVSLKEYIWSVKDWSSVELSLLLLILSIAFAVVHSKKWNSDAMDAEPVSLRILSKLRQLLT